MNFDSPGTRRTYSERSVHEGWLARCKQYLAPKNKDIVDVGCGGGIYSLGFISLGARTVMGVDSSAQYLEEARLASLKGTNLSFALGTGQATGLPDACADIVFQRAVIHPRVLMEILGHSQISITIGVDGLPIISYYGGGNLKVAHCSNALCLPYFRRR